MDETTRTGRVQMVLCGCTFVIVQLFCLEPSRRERSVLQHTGFILDRLLFSFTARAACHALGVVADQANEPALPSYSEVDWGRRACYDRLAHLLRFLQCIQPGGTQL